MNQEKGRKELEGLIFDLFPKIKKLSDLATELAEGEDIYIELEGDEVRIILGEICPKCYQAFMSIKFLGAKDIYSALKSHFEDEKI